MSLWHTALQHSRGATGRCAASAARNNSILRSPAGMARCGASCYEHCSAVHIGKCMCSTAMQSTCIAVTCCMCLPTLQGVTPPDLTATVKATLLRWLNDEYLRACAGNPALRMDITPPPNWAHRDEHTPQQPNTYDCGAYVCGWITKKVRPCAVCGRRYKCLAIGAHVDPLLGCRDRQRAGHSRQYMPLACAKRWRTGWCMDGRAHPRNSKRCSSATMSTVRCATFLLQQHTPVDAPWLTCLKTESYSERGCIPMRIVLACHAPNGC